MLLPDLTILQEEPDGVMTVKFRDPISAQACVLVRTTPSFSCAVAHLHLQQKMQGRFFDGRRVEASLYSGKQRFKKSGTDFEFEGEGDAVEKKRLDEFANWLLTEGD